jgi:4-diphosphocytidyl-2-C-methyl-D-erythritol kinase
MIVKAPAKINLYLEILNKRQDGYHNIESIMHTVSLFDILEFEPIEENKIELICLGTANLSNDKSNLVYKAVMKFKEQYNINKGIKIKLTKNIPTGAGLGGGSSDAAATLVALNKIWNVNADIKQLELLGSKLGADVPFFITGGTAKISQIGNVVEKLKSNLNLSFILVNPNFGVSTAYAYSKIKFPLTNAQKINTITEVITKGKFNVEEARDLFFNRFEEFVFDEYPQIKQIKEILDGLGCISLMSGSGATVFGLVKDVNKVSYILDELKKYNWSVWLTNSVESL